MRARCRRAAARAPAEPWLWVAAWAVLVTAPAPWAARVQELCKPLNGGFFTPAACDSW